jgi:hypothetical protein
MPLPNLSATSVHHFPHEVYPDYPYTWMHMGRLNGHIGRARGNVQKAVGSKEAHFPDGTSPPGNISSQAEQMVQEIVFFRNGGENFPHHTDVLYVRRFRYRGVFLSCWFSHLSSLPFHISNVSHNTISIQSSDAFNPFNLMERLDSSRGKGEGVKALAGGNYPIMEDTNPLGH